MRHLNLLIGATIVVLSPTVYGAVFFDGHELKMRLENWEARNTQEQVSASAGVGFVIGIHDVSEGVSVCTPKEATVGQVVSVVLEYLRANASELRLSAETLAKQALAKSWPCAATQTSKRESGNSQYSKSRPKPELNEEKDVSPF